MQDTTVIVGHFAYMLRVLIPVKGENPGQASAWPGFNPATVHFHNWVERYKCTHFIVGNEFGSLTGQPHLQGIVWFEALISTDKLRSWWVTKYGKGSCALTNAKKIGSLSKYCMKDHVFNTNLSSEQIVAIGKWKFGEGSDYTFMCSLYDFSHEFMVKHKEYYNKTLSPSVDNFILKIDDDDYEMPSTREFVLAVLQFYREAGKRPSKATIDYLLFKENIYTNSVWYDRNYYNNY